MQACTKQGLPQNEGNRGSQRIRNGSGKSWKGQGKIEQIVIESMGLRFLPKIKYSNNV
jgi:hypothetical protein